uniref:DUF2442 domain-containing protein n=1 Tax=Candidatus Kentrum sp. TC TaxID=2126339 RepID=A0A450YCM8_9GAMM|nr:MAG: Protein of unknown function (DUF2442) [Candidatus Kentron sp. TC]VFK43949.1 MAG: Protein of unknown function (DUF2442) [Candidatus Kentron sp. TC]VFK55316.1 MAG: Protein of unknown function (DUF2442) [Candidatus Kentron sp. TC]
MLTIDKAEYIGDYTIHLRFNNGKEGAANLRNTIFDDKRPIFSDLKEESNFSAFELEHGTITWPNRLDLAPEYLFWLAFQDNEDQRTRFERWGYVG